MESVTQKPLDDNQPTDAQQPLFINRCLYSLSVYKAVMQSTQKKPTNIVCFIVSLLLTALGVVLAILEGTYFTLIMGIVCTALTVFIIVAIPSITAKSVYNQNKLLYKGEVMGELRLYKDYMVSVNTNAGGELKLQYKDIIKVKQTDTLIILLIPHKQALPIAKDGFTVGNEEMFMEFINQIIPMR